jgi:hypothetical protein
VVRYAYGSQRELLQYVIDPGHRSRINRAMLEENVELREFAAGPTDISWLAPRPVTERELRSSGGKSSNPSNLKMITEALRDALAELGVPLGTNWLASVYQPANRLAWLWFCRSHATHRANPVPVWQVSLYFCGVHYRSVTGMVGPRNETRGGRR